MPHTQDVTDAQVYLDSERGELGSQHASNDAPCPQAPANDPAALKWLYTKLAARAKPTDHSDWLEAYSLA